MSCKALSQRGQMFVLKREVCDPATAHVSLDKGDCVSVSVKKERETKSGFSHFISRQDTNPSSQRAFYTSFTYDQTRVKVRP